MQFCIITAVRFRCSYSSFKGIHFLLSLIAYLAFYVLFHRANCGSQQCRNASPVAFSRVVGMPTVELASLGLDLYPDCYLDSGLCQDILTNCTNLEALWSILDFSDFTVKLARQLVSSQNLMCNVVPMYVVLLHPKGNFNYIAEHDQTTKCSWRYR